MFEQPFEHVELVIYRENEVVVNTVAMANGQRTADGYLYSGSLTVPDLEARLEHYTIVWSAYNADAPGLKSRQTGRIFIVNPSILSATDDMKLLIQKSRTTVAHQQDLLFTIPLLLAYLRRGRDAFNGAYGVLTSFTMMNAQGSVREFWLRTSEVVALRAQFLAEGEKVFNFSGQAISLDVDRTQYYQQLADTLQSQLDNEVKPYKTNLIIKGILGGDGNLNPAGGVGLRPGAIGAVGITLSPASPWSWGRLGGRWGLR